MSISEKTFQGQVQQLARMTGWKAYHTYDSRRSEPGFPDLVLAHPSRGVLYRELKTATGRVSPHQRAWLDLLKTAGADADIWRPADLESGRIGDELMGRAHTERG